MSTAWPTARMSDVAPLVRRPVETAAHKNYREVGIRSFGKGIFHKPLTTGLEIGSKRVFAIEPGDLLFNIVFAWEGAGAVATDTERGMIGSHRFLTCVADKRQADAKFLSYWFQRGEGLAALQQASPGGAGRNRTLGVEKLAQIAVPIPPLQEQRRIVARIEALATKVKEARALRDNSAAESRALMPAAVSAFERIWLSTNTKLGSGVLSYKNGLSRRPSGEEDGPIVLRLADVSEGVVNLSGPRRVAQSETEREAYSLTNADLLVVRVNGSRSIVGRFIEVPISEESLSFNDHLIRIRLDQAVFNPRFVAAMARGGAARKHIETAAITTAGQLTINQTMLADTPMPRPPLAEQQRIVAELDALQARVDTVKALQADTAAELDAMMPAILDKAFKGEL